MQTWPHEVQMQRCVPATFSPLMMVIGSSVVGNGRTRINFRLSKGDKDRMDSCSFFQPFEKHMKGFLDKTMDMRKLCQARAGGNSLRTTT